MRGDVQEIFRMTPHEKQVMMFSATLSKDVRPVCRKFMQDVSQKKNRCFPRTLLKCSSSHVCRLLFTFFTRGQWR